jgi:hypothetical protein
MSAPRAQLVRLPPWRLDEQRLIMMPDGMQVLARNRGRLPAEYLLPTERNTVGDAWAVGQNLCVWLVAPGAAQPTWIDP